MTHTILNQLGGNKFIAMTGAKDFVHNGEGYLRFSIPRNKTRANLCVVRIDKETDLYVVSFLKRSKLDVNIMLSVTGLYAADLCRVFEESTGFATSL